MESIGTSGRAKGEVADRGGSIKLKISDRGGSIKILKLCDAGRYGPDASEVQGTLLDDAKNILYRLDSNR